MDEPMSDSHFRKMALMYKFRDFFIPRSKILSEIDIKRGFVILDYGCGPGSYSVVAARLVGETGKVYALDIHPLAIEKVKTAASKKGLTNVETIQSDGATGLDSESVDVVLLCDILHHLSERDAVLKELYRVLKPKGKVFLSVFFSEGEPYAEGRSFFYQPSCFLERVSESGFRHRLRGKMAYHYQHNWYVLEKDG